MYSVLKVIEKCAQYLAMKTLTWQQNKYLLHAWRKRIHIKKILGEFQVLKALLLSQLINGVSPYYWSTDVIAKDVLIGKPAA